MQKLIYNFLHNYYEKTVLKLNLIACENFLSDNWFFPNRYILKEGYYISNLLNMINTLDKNVHDRITFIKTEDTTLFLIKKIIREESLTDPNKVFFIDLPKKEFFEPGAEIDYLVDKNLFLLQDLQRQAILNDWRVLLFYRLGHERILTFFDDDKLKRLMNYYNNVTYFWKGKQVRVARYERGKTGHFILKQTTK